MTILEQAEVFFSGIDYQKCKNAYYQRESCKTSLQAVDLALGLGYKDITDPDKWIELETKLIQLKTEYQSSVKQLEQLGVQSATAQETLEQSTKIKEFYKEALEVITSRYLDSLSGLLSDVYSSVYQDESKRVCLVMEEYRGKKVIKLNIVNHKEGQDWKEDLSDDGGSASIVLGLIVAIYFILTTGLARIIFLDETFSALHNDTLGRFMPFLKHFVDEEHFVFVIVAHDYYRIKDYITKAYEVKDGEYHEVKDLDAFFEKNLSLGDSQ